MHKIQKDDKKSSLVVMNAIFNGGTVLLGVCLTVVSLFQITDKRTMYIVDEVFGVLSILFSLSVVCSYLSLRNTSKMIYKQTANHLFLATIILMLITGILLIMEL